MAVIVFAGPSLAPGDRDAFAGLSFRPPARCGDILRAAGESPHAIGLIDGFFETAAAPWHKEILWALAAGIPVYGAASIGALRAAELAPFGMIGVGEVFELYRSGAIERDDEVAVLHGPAELDYVALTVALVDIRATLAKAVAAGIVSARLGDALLGAAASLFYKDRAWDRILAACRGASGAPIRVPPGFHDWLSTNAMSQKRADALALLELVGADTAWASARAAPPTFVATKYFEELKRFAG